MNPVQGQLHLVRATDPQSSRDAAKGCNPGTKRATIIHDLARFDAFHPCVWINADLLVERHGGQRNVWARRLCDCVELGLLERDDSTRPIRFCLTDAGREAARFLRESA